MRYLWLVGLVIACGSAIALAVLPVEVFLGPGFLALVLGLALFAAGVFLRQRQEKVDIGTAMRRFAETNGGAFQEVLPADQLPASISLFRSGERQRCTNAIALPCAGRSCLLFRFEAYYSSSRPGEVGSWVDYYVAYVPQALPGMADFQVRPRFSPRGPFVSVVMVSLLVAVSSLVSLGVTRSTTALVGGLLLSAGFLLFGSVVVWLASGRSDPAPSPSFLDQQLLELFSRQGLCAECVEGNLAVWNVRTIERQWRTGWNRSFRPLDAWVAKELQGRLEAARQVLSRAAVASEKSEWAKPG